MEKPSDRTGVKMAAWVQAGDPLWRWYLSSLVYRFSYLQIAHQVDADLLQYLGKRIQGAVVLDCGCGPGVVVEKLLRHGAARVVALDANPAMLAQTRRRLAACTGEEVVTVQAAFNPQLFKDLRKGFPERPGWDLILFKRSLYMRPEEAALLLSAAGKQLAPGGTLAVIHPERSLARYAFGPGWQIRSYTFYHLFNRFISLFADRFGFGLYTLYTQAELLELVRQAHPGWKVEFIPSRQKAYNLVAAWR